MNWTALWGSHMLLAEDVGEPDPYALADLEFLYGSATIALSTCVTKEPLRLEVPHTSAHVFTCMPQSGRCTALINGFESRPSALTPLIISPGMQLSMRLDGETSLKILRLDVCAINKALEAALGYRPPRPIRFDTQADLGSAAALRWIYALQLLEVETQQSESILRTSLGESSLAHLFAAALLSLAKSNYQEELENDIHGATVKRAVNFINSHLSLPLLIEDVADAAMVSVRTLQQCFKEEVGTTISCYMRAARLERVRQELLESNPAPSIAVLGAKWGIPHAGRLSRWYKERFGETPSQTLEHRSRYA